MRARLAVLFVGLLLVSVAAPIGTNVATAHDLGFDLTHNKPVVYPGDTYRVSVHQEGDANGRYLAVISKSVRDTHGLTDYEIDVRVSTDGTFAFDVPKRPRYGRYQAIVVDAGPDGEFGSERSVEDIRRLARNFKERKFEHFKSSLLSATVDPSESDDTHHVLRFGVATRGFNVYVPEQVRAGRDMTVSGRYSGQGHGRVKVEFRYLRDDRRRVAIRSEAVSDDDPDDDDTRWEVDVNTAGLPLGKYHVIVYHDGTPVHYRPVWLVPRSLAAAEAGEPLFVPYARPERPSAAPSPYRWASVAGIESLDVGQGRATVARVREVEEFEHTHDGKNHEHDHLAEVWLDDQGNEYRESIPAVTTTSAHLRPGDWVVAYVVPIAADGVDDEKRNRYFSLGGDQDLYHALGLATVGSSPPPVPLSSADDPGMFVGARVKLSTTIAGIDSRLSGPDTIYLNTTNGRLPAEGVRADGLAVGDRVTVTGELHAASVGKDAATPAIVLSDSTSTTKIVTMAGATVRPTGGDPTVAKALRPRLTPLSKAANTSPPTVRTAFTVTIKETASTGDDSALAEALVVGEDGGRAIVKYHAGLGLRRNERIMVPGVLMTDRLVPGRPPTLVPARIGIAESDRYNATKPLGNATNATNGEATNTTDATATPESDGGGDGTGGADSSDGSNESGPGFGLTVGLVAALVALLGAARRWSE